MSERSQKIASTAKKELANMINLKEIKEFRDSRMHGVISITEIIVEKGYQHLRFYISAFKNDNPQGVIDVLDENKSVIRGELCRRLKLRAAPTLSFKLDDSIERGFAVQDILNKISYSSETVDAEE